MLSTVSLVYVSSEQDTLQSTDICQQYTNMGIRRGTKKTGGGGHTSGS